MDWLLPLLPALLLILLTRANRRRGAAAWRRTGPAWRRTYSRRSFLRLGGAVLVAGALAYSGLDEAIETALAPRPPEGRTRRLAAFLKVWGERFWFGIWALLAALDTALRSTALTRWGRRNFRAMVVGLPMLWGTQRLLGGSRPGQRPEGPRWRPLASDKSASGHTFIAAVPWLTLARRTGDGLGRAAAVVASTLTGWSRLADRAHYPSQVFLGWFIAWTAVDGAGAIDAIAREPRPAGDSAPDREPAAGPAESSPPVT